MANFLTELEALTAIHKELRRLNKTMQYINSLDGDTTSLQNEIKNRLQNEND